MDKNFLQRVLDLVSSPFVDWDLNYEIELVENRKMTLMVSYGGAWEADFRPMAVLHLEERDPGLGVEITCTLCTDKLSPIPPCRRQPCA